MVDPGEVMVMFMARGKLSLAEDMEGIAVEDMEVMDMVMARDLLSPAEGAVMEDTALDTVMAAIEEDMEVTAGEDMEDTTDVNKKCLNQIEFLTNSILNCFTWNKCFPMVK